MLKIKKEYSEYITKSFRIPTEFVERLDKIAAIHNSSVNKVVIQCLEFALDNIEDDNDISSEKEQT